MNKFLSATVLCQTFDKEDCLVKHVYEDIPIAVVTNEDSAIFHCKSFKSYIEENNKKEKESFLEDINNDVGWDCFYAEKKIVSFNLYCLSENGAILRDYEVLLV